MDIDQRDSDDDDDTNPIMSLDADDENEENLLSASISSSAGSVVTEYNDHDKDVERESDESMDALSHRSFSPFACDPYESYDWEC